jgi:hypothetical protein
MSKRRAKRAEALAAIIECVDFWEPILEEMALACDTAETVYEHPWVPVEFARKIRELATAVRAD